MTSGHTRAHRTSSASFWKERRCAPGFSAALHTNSHEERIVTVSGTFIHGPEGKPEVRLPAGSYLLEPANYRHTTACDKASECVFFIESNGKFDIKMVEEKKAPAKM
jgi:quercetin dioxygenase-like cupin family protein